MLTHKHKEVVKIHENFRENVDYEQFLLFGEVRSASQKKSVLKILMLASYGELLEWRWCTARLIERGNQEGKN